MCTGMRSRRNSNTPLSDVVLETDEPAANSSHQRRSSVPAARVARSCLRNPPARIFWTTCAVAAMWRTTAVKEVGSPAMVVNVKMVIKEESMEMLLNNAAAEPDAPQISRLVPE